MKRKGRNAIHTFLFSTKFGLNEKTERKCKQKAELQSNLSLEFGKKFMREQKI